MTTKGTSAIDDIIKRQPPMVKQPAWLGLDSRNGRYLFGAGDAAVVDGMVDPRQTITIAAMPYTLFRGERLFVQRACAPDFLIHRVLVGQRLCGMLGMDPIPADIFAVDFDDLPKVNFEDAGDKAIRIEVGGKSASEFLGQPFLLPTCQPAIHIAMQVENIGREPRRFLGAFVGSAVF